MKLQDKFPLVKMSWDECDAWGSCMGWAFQCAAALTIAGEDVPEHWKYRHAPCHNELNEMEDWEAIEITRAVEAGTIEWEDVVWLGNLLVRYADNLERQGRSY